MQVVLRRLDPVRYFEADDEPCMDTWLVSEALVGIVNGKTTSKNLPKMKGKEVIVVAILVRIHHGCEALLK